MPDFLPHSVDPVDASRTTQVKKMQSNTTLSSGAPVCDVTLVQNFAGAPEIASGEIFANLHLVGADRFAIGALFWRARGRFGSDDRGGSESERESTVGCPPDD